MLRIEHGSIFDSKCDLLVIPCDDEGGVTSAVFVKLKEHGIATDVGQIPFGNVHFREVRFDNASIIAYAASVDCEVMKSSDSAIESIGRNLASYAEKNGVLSVNLPLLGTGAGGLTPVQSLNALSKYLRNDPRITYTIYCLTREVFNEVSAAVEDTRQSLRNPRVFVSYTGLNPANAVWVKALSTRLRSNGVNVRLDAFHLRPGADLPQWMTNEVTQADKVLLVCDRLYMEKADFRKGGVGWETMIIQGDMLAQGDNRQKYIALVRENAIDQALPIYMKSKMALAWGADDEINEDRFRELLMCIFDCDDEPELGPIPDFIRSRVARTSQQA